MMATKHELQYVWLDGEEDSFFGLEPVVDYDPIWEALSLIRYNLDVFDETVALVLSEEGKKRRLAVPNVFSIFCLKEEKPEVGKTLYNVPKPDT